MNIQVFGKTVLLLSLTCSAVSAGVTLPVTATAGSTFTVDFDGYGGSPVQTVTGLTSSATFSNFAFTDFTSTNRTRITFEALIANDSSGPITASRVSGLGFRTTRDIDRSASNSVTGVFDNVSYNGNMPVGIGRVEFCLSNVNCAGSGGDGVTLGNTGTAYASIFVAGTGVRELQFDDMFVRYQSIAGAPNGVTSAVGAPVVPEPASYVVLSLGLGAVALRKRLKLRA